MSKYEPLFNDLSRPISTKPLRVPVGATCHATPCDFCTPKRHNYRDSKGRFKKAPKHWGVPQYFIMLVALVLGGGAVAWVFQNTEGFWLIVAYIINFVRGR